MKKQRTQQADLGSWIVNYIMRSIITIVISYYLLLGSATIIVVLIVALMITESYKMGGNGGMLNISTSVIAYIATLMVIVGTLSLVGQERFSIHGLLLDGASYLSNIFSFGRSGGWTLGFNIDGWILQGLSYFISII